MTGIGDIHSTAKGSGARFNSGKAPYDLIPLVLLADSAPLGTFNTPAQLAARHALRLLGQYQSGAGSLQALFDAMVVLGWREGWEECAQVFDYGRKKYAAWNWAKGMPWSVPVACAARHLLAIMRGENLDEDKEGAPGSHLPHRGHVFCNFVMLLIYHDTYPEGNDLPAPGLLAKAVCA